MLLWEHLGILDRIPSDNGETPKVTQQTKRLPFDMRCLAVTKSGRRCKGRVLPHREHCVCHDPEAIAKRRASAARSRGRSKLARLPEGYLRRISDRRSVGQAMDRLYREIRLGIITPDMGRVLFDVLTRLLDSGLADLDATPRAPGRSKAARLRPKVAELLTRAERRAWKTAVEAAPSALVEDQPQPVKRQVEKTPRPDSATEIVPERALAMPLQAAT